MYNTSLQQFVFLFESSIDNAPPAPVTKDRVQNIITKLTYQVYRYINRGLFERDKSTFKLMISMKVQIKDDKLEQKDVNFFLKAGSSLEEKNNPLQGVFPDIKVFQNIKALSMHKFGKSHSAFFKDIIDKVQKKEKEWEDWVNYDAPESQPIPEMQDKISSDPISSFLHMVLVRCA